MATGLSDDDFAEIEHAAYEAAIIPELWPDVLARLGDMTNTVGGAFVALNERGVHIVCAPAMEGARKRILEEGCMNRSGRAAGVISRGLVGAPRFLNEYDFYGGPEGADCDPIVTEVFRREGMGWAAGWITQMPHGDTVIMNVEQYFDRGPIVGESLSRLDGLYSVFARAAMLSARADFARVRTAMETLATVGIPAAAVTPTGRVVLANESFGRASHIWTTRHGERLGVHDRFADAMLSESLAALRAVRGPRSVPVRATPGGPVTAILQVIPVRRATHDIFGSTDAIVVLTTTSEGTADATLIHALFDLTPAEIAVAQAIAAGKTVTQIAAGTGRRVATVRNQLKSAMSKTGSHRQTDLVILMRQLGGAPS